MRNTQELREALDRLARATKGMSLDETVAFIDAEISSPNNAPYRSHFELRKAHILGAYGRTAEASGILVRCAAENGDDDEMQFFAGQSLLETEDFALAIRYLSRCIEIGESSGDLYYADSAYLPRAYCAARLGRFDVAQEDLVRVEDGDKLPWLHASPVVSKASIQRMLGIDVPDNEDPVSHDDVSEYPPLTAAQQELVSQLTEAQLQSIDAAIMQNVSHNWRKVLRVIYSAMSDNDARVSGAVDVFYCQRVIRLVELGLIESVGNLRKMGCSEVRLPQAGGQVQDK
ncbi:tetratricopeptide (TPR) repeat protein [Paraburkholderia sp. EB58]|uniref:DUF3658 domain-containing protein n=1 Tax=Paraburkholderia sp. EB58 TaxID=3035125 RepID=UPI003D1C86E2